jgi:hypothetical protein
MVDIMGSYLSSKIRNVEPVGIPLTDEWFICQTDQGIWG